MINLTYCVYLLLLKRKKEQLRAQHQRHYQKHRLKIRARQRAYKLANQEKCKTADARRMREWRKRNPEKVKVANKNNYDASYHKKKNQEWREANPAYGKNWYKENAEHAREVSKKWRTENPEKERAKILRRRSNPANRILGSLRTRVRQALMGRPKLKPTLDLLGCSAEEARQHLERQFQAGMTWENYGRKGWHIDHIKPCASFDLTIPEEQKKCFHYTNLQPLWAVDNLIKGDRHGGR